MIKPGNIFSVHPRLHPLVTLDVVPWLIRSDVVWLKIYDNDVVIGAGLYRCGLTEFNIFFKRNMNKLPKTETIVVNEILAIALSETELRKLCSGMNNIFV